MGTQRKISNPVRNKFFNGANGVNKKMSPLPPDAKMVFKGIIFEVWQWQQKMYNGTTETFERLKRPDTVQVIPIVGDKILVQEQEQPDQPAPFFSFPGGRCEENEDPLTAAKREMLEETGYSASNWQLWKEHRPVSKIEWTVYTYIARYCLKKGEPKLDAGEKITTRLITFEEFLKLPDDPNFYDQNLALTLLRAQQDKKIAKNLHRLLFGS